jgi:glycerophosphoryl diester phosphodiesterase
LTGGGDTIPTLGALLAQVGGRVPLVVEIKDQGGALDATGVGPLEARVAAVLAGYAGPVAVMSFNPESMAAMARFAPGVPRGIVAGGDYGALPTEQLAALRGMTAAEATGSAFVSVHHCELPSDRSRALRAAGLAILCWTIRSAEDAQTVAPHADAITFEGFAA